VPTISRREDYNGFVKKTGRLKLGALVAEAESTLGGFGLAILEKKHANGTKGLRVSIDAAFNRLGGWKKLTSGGIDWTKQGPGGSTIGVEVQVSGRSDMLAVDIMHLKEKMLSGEIDIGLIIVPDDRLSRFLTDRTPNMATAVKHVAHRASDLPIRIVAFQHDSLGEALLKMRTNLGKPPTVASATQFRKIGPVSALCKKMSHNCGNPSSLTRTRGRLGRPSSPPVRRELGGAAQFPVGLFSSIAGWLQPENDCSSPQSSCRHA
jgi:hypothetical protein